LAEVAEGFDAAAVGLVRLPAAAGLLLVAAMMERGSSLRRRVVSRRTMWMMAGSGIFAQGVASILFILALIDIGAGQTVVLFSTAPLIALPLGAIFLRENVTVWVAIGSVIALIGIAFIA
jgi:drug/metabolite transporter (DMT)-like permease